MLKKVVIAGLAVAAGVVVLAWLSPPLFDWAVHQGKALKSGAEDAIPLEQRIDIPKDKLKDFDKEKVKYFDQVAHQEREVKQLTADVNTESDQLAARWNDIQARRDQLSTQQVKLAYGGRDYTRQEFERRLSKDFEGYQADENTLNTKKDLLDSRAKALEDGKASLATLESKKAELAAKLSKMEDDLKIVRERQAENNINVDGNDLVKWSAEADELAGKIADQKRSLELQDEYGHHQTATPATQPAAGSDIQKQIDDYKAARNGAPKHDVAEQH